MAIEKAFVVPHPPLIVPEIGRGEEKKIQSTIDAYDRIASEIADIRPDTIIITSPHTVMYGDYFHISPGKTAHGSFASFGTPKVAFDVEYDQQLAKKIAEHAQSVNVQAGFKGERDQSLDHGVMVPLYFIDRYLSDYQIVRIGLSGLSFKKHHRFGEAIKAAVNDADKRVVFVASGDLSHRLKHDGPYGFAEEGPVFDEQVVDCLKQNDLEGLMNIKPSLAEKAGECGLRSFIIMTGALDGESTDAEFHSYEGPFGVGYAVAGFTPGHTKS